MKQKWNLAHILELENFDNKLDQINNDIIKIASAIALLNPDIQTSKFNALLRDLDLLQENVARLYDLPALMETVDQTGHLPKELKSRATDVSIKLENETRKFWHWVKGKEVEGIPLLDNENANRLFSKSGVYQYSLERIRKLASYSLSAGEEEIISNKDQNGVAVLNDLRSVIETGQEFKLRLGKRVRVISNQSELTKMVYSEKPVERKAAYRALFETYEQNLTKFFMIYQAVVKDWNYEAVKRGYSSATEVRNVANDLGNEVVDSLLGVCQAQKNLFHKYFKLKAKKLGVKKLSRYDLYAPITNRKQRKIDYSHALEIVLNAMRDFSAEFAQKAEQIIVDGHIDSHPSSTKQSGAFCATVVPQISPYILLNYTDTLRDVMTLAHELGHGIHSLYANQLPVSLQHAPLPLAETASTLAELIVFESLLNTVSIQEREQLIFDKLSDIYATIMRQAYFVIFENKAHKLIVEGTNPEKLSEVYYQILKDQFGDSVKLEPEFKREWAVIPHIVRTPFYCYSYSFGELLALSLFEKYKTEGKAFIPKIEVVLKAGGSKKPEELLAEIGLDITKKEFWENGFKYIEEMMEMIRYLVVTLQQAQGDTSA